MCINPIFIYLMFFVVHVVMGRNNGKAQRNLFCLLRQRIIDK